MAEVTCRYREDGTTWFEVDYKMGGAMKISFTVEEEIQGKCEHETKIVDASIEIEGDAPMVNKVVGAIRKLKLEEI